VRHVYETGLGDDIVDVDDIVGAERDEFVLEAVQRDAERLVARSVFVDCVQTLLRQVVPEPDHPSHVCTGRHQPIVVDSTLYCIA